MARTLLVLKTVIKLMKTAWRKKVKRGNLRILMIMKKRSY